MQEKHAAVRNTTTTRWINITVFASAVTFLAHKPHFAHADSTAKKLRHLSVGDDAPVDLGIDIEKLPPSQKAKIPTVGAVNDLYGSEPVILGMDRCEAFRDSYAPEDRFMAIAGLYNTGTNFLLDTLSSNCVLPGRAKSYQKYGQRGEIGRGILSGVHWGKHSPLSTRPKYVDTKYVGRADFARFNSMPIVVVKDPVFWMSSMCHRWYDVNSIPIDTNWFGRCPYLTSDELGTPIGIKGTLLPWNDDFEYESMLDLWNNFYGQYEEFQAPRLIVRYEDLIFHGDRVVRDICSCAGGEVKEFAPEEESTKTQVLDAEGNAHGLVQSAILYGSKEERNSIFKTDRDRAFAEKNLNEGLMTKLKYQKPVDPVTSSDEYKPKIPHTIWFVAQKDILTEKYFENAVATINAYKQLWEEPDAPVKFLNEEDCVELLEDVLPEREGIAASFKADKNEERKVAICKIAALYKHGGYHFATDVQTVQPFHPRDDVSFVSPLEWVTEGCLMSTAFTASAPEHVILREALDEIAFSYEVSDMFDPSMLMQKMMVETYHERVTEQEKARGVQFLSEAHMGSISYSATYKGVGKQTGRGFCDIVIHDPATPDRILFFSHFLGSEKCETGRIPRKIWFSHDNKRILQSKKPKAVYDVVSDIIDDYRMFWNEPDAPAVGLTERTCEPIIQQVNETLLVHFKNLEDKRVKDDVCRLSAMYVHGGYFFGATPRSRDEKFTPGDSDEFVVTSENHLSFFNNQDFAAVVPEHPVLKRALRIVLRQLDSAMASGRRVTPSIMSFPKILAKSFHSTPPRFRGEAKLLEKEENEFKVTG